jgi:hypothetical protein
LRRELLAALVGGAAVGTAGREVLARSGRPGTPIERLYVPRARPIEGIRPASAVADSDGFGRAEPGGSGQSETTDVADASGGAGVAWEQLQEEFAAVVVGEYEKEDDGWWPPFGLGDDDPPQLGDYDDAVVGYRDHGSVPGDGRRRSSSVALLGGPMVADEYVSLAMDADEAVAEANLAFFLNLLDVLDRRPRVDRSAGPSTVLVDEGHGQRGVPWTVLAEDAAYFERFTDLVGRPHRVEGVEELTERRLAGARALVVSTPRAAVSAAERERIDAFAARGGAVVFVADQRSTEAAHRRLNDLTDRYGMRFGDGFVMATEDAETLGERTRVAVTDWFDERMDGRHGLFERPPVSMNRVARETVVEGEAAAGASTVHTYFVQSTAPVALALDLQTTNPTDLDLYVTLDGRRPTPDDYDRKATTPTPWEELRLQRVSPESAVGVLVHTDTITDRSPSYELSIREFAL